MNQSISSCCLTVSKLLLNNCVASVLEDVGSVLVFTCIMCPIVVHKAGMGTGEGAFLQAIEPTDPSITELHCGSLRLIRQVVEEYCLARLCGKVTVQSTAVQDECHLL